MDFSELRGAGIAEVLPALAELRIRVFRDWPYLYDGSRAYEESYLRKFSADPDAFIAIARDGARVVGASTASPLIGHADTFAAPFAALGQDPAKVFYFGESVLLPEYRGRGIGRRFFAAREREARRQGRFAIAAFCAVARDAGDPRRPPGYRPLDPFWSSEGFRPAEGVTARLAWKEVGAPDEVDHLMRFWTKTL